MYKEKIQQAQKHSQSQEFDRAIEVYKEAFKEQATLNDLMDLGLIYLEIGDFQEAKQVFNTIISYDYTFDRAYYALALICEEFNDSAGAIKYYLEAIKYNSKFDAAYFNIAGIYDESGQEEKAFEYYKKTLFINFRNFWAHVNIGSLYERHNMNELALKHTLMAYEINPNEKKVCFNLGVIYSKLKDYNNALKYYNEELKKEDHYQMTYLNLGLLYKDVYQDLNQAKITYIAGIKRDNKDFNLWFNLACLYALLEDFQETYSCLLYAFLLEPKIQDDINNDPELARFRDSSYYLKLKDVM